MLNQTEFQSFLDGLDNQLRRLPAGRQLAFAAACCERHFTSYVIFSEEYKWGNPKVLRKALDGAWEAAADKAPALAAYDLLAQSMRQIPHSDDFSTPSADYAQNVAIMVAHVAEFLNRNDIKYVVQTATLARDLIDAEVQAEELDASDPDLGRKITENPLMQTELASQKGWLAKLSEITNRDDVLAFRRVASSQQK